MKNKNIKNKILIAIISVLFIIMIIPLFYISKYNHSCADDYTYGKTTYKVFQNTHSLIEVIKTTDKQVKDMYNNWQGTYSAMFIMAIQPAVFGEQYYFLTTIIILGMFIIANLYLLKIIFKYYFEIKDNLVYLITALSVILFSVAFVPFPVEAFYWFNGSIFYTFYYSIMLILIGIILKLIKEESNKKATLNTIVAAILAIFLGGGNYTTGLLINLILACIELILIFKKDKKAINIGIIFIISMTGFFISIIAPGNALRQETVNNQGVKVAIRESFNYARVFLRLFLKDSSKWLFILLIPILYKIVKKTEFKFKWPAAFTIISICIYAAQFTPPLYAQGFAPGRLLNIIYYSIYWLVLLNLAYWIGYINTKIDIEKHLKSINYKKIIIFVIIILGLISISLDFKITNIYTAMNSLVSGEAEQYDKEIQARMKVYEDDKIKNVEFDELTVKPRLLFFSDIKEDENNWENQQAALFYNKTKVKLKASQEK